jgi:hypothetical protein
MACPVLRRRAGVAEQISLEKASMSPETLEALKGSIEKWEKIVAGTGADYGPNNCPLCKMFRKSRGEWWDMTCDGCPVKAHTGKDGCEDTPYDSFEGSYKDDEEAAARAELEFLRSLLPKKEGA